MKNITYIFSQNRKKNFHNKESYAKDFYYGLHNFDNKYHNIEIIEFSQSKSLINSLLIIFFSILTKYISNIFHLI